MLQFKSILLFLGFTTKKPPLNRDHLMCLYLQRIGSTEIIRQYYRRVGTEITAGVGWHGQNFCCSGLKKKNIPVHSSNLKHISRHSASLLINSTSGSQWLRLKAFSSSLQSAAGLQRSLKRQQQLWISTETQINQQPYCYNQSLQLETQQGARTTNF